MNRPEPIDLEGMHPTTRHVVEPVLDYQGRIPLDARQSFAIGVMVGQELELTRKAQGDFGDFNNIAEMMTSRGFPQSLVSTLHHYLKTGEYKAPAKSRED